MTVSLSGITQWSQDVEARLTVGGGEVWASPDGFSFCYVRDFVSFSFAISIHIQSKLSKKGEVNRRKNDMLRSRGLHKLSFVNQLMMAVGRKKKHT